MKKSSWILVIAVAGIAGYAAYDYYRGGYHKLPALPKGAHTLSFQNGLRAIMLVPDVRPKRKYLGVPAEVPSWFEDSWATCIAPTKKELASAEVLAGARLEAVCRIPADGQEVVRGLVYSAPDI